jgi:hypothetical protein
MILKLVLLLSFVVLTGPVLSQNSVIIFSSNAGLFNAKIEGLSSADIFEQEVKFAPLNKDTLDVTISTQDNLTHKQRLYLLQKARPVKNKEFVYSLERDEHKKLRLVFLSVQDLKPLPNPLLPEKPAVDTSYKWHNNVFGTLFELKDGKPIFYYNVPKNSDCKTGMTQANLDHGIAYLGRTTIGLEKYTYAKEIVKNNCLTSAQLLAILKMIEFELDKLKLVKDAYPNLVDKTELKTVGSTFRFESSKKEFADMLADPKSMLPSQNKINCTKAESDSVVKQLVYDVKLFANDYQRFKFMKEKAYGYCFSSVQFKDILTLFIHDREKLDLTKQFYNNITDKENLGVIKEVFSYNESVVNLESFIKSN